MTRALILVRLKPRQPDGTMIGESRRTCHLVPLPEADAMPDTMPQYLTAYCGLRIAPGSGEVLTSPAGMPCEMCLARSPVVSMAMLRQVRDRRVPQLSRPAER
jgi:hypothetical protein